MALSDCPKCWDTPCVCGHEYISWTDKRMQEFIESILSTRDVALRIDILQSVLKKIQTENT